MVGPAVVYTHIPKTGGSAFGSALYGLFDPQRIVISTADNDDLSAILPELQAGGAVGGHVRYPSIRPHAPDALFLASVRDPIDRIVSHYFFLIRTAGIEPHVYQDDLRGGFDNFYRRWIVGLNSVNLQCKFFAQSGLAADAIPVITADYRLVWDTDRTDEAWAHAHEIVSDRLGISGREAPALQNIYVAPRSEGGGVDGSRPQSYRDFLGPSAVETILYENAEDARLYRWVSDRGGLVTPLADPGITFPRNHHQVIGAKAIPRRVSSSSTPSRHSLQSVNSRTPL